MGINMKKIIIDAGHGGRDPGASYDGSYESDINLSISNLLFLMLKTMGFCVDRSRVLNKNIPLKERVFIANQLNSDLFVSIHCDAFKDLSSSGMTCHVSTHASKASKMFAEKISESMSISFPKIRNRGTRKTNYYVLRHTKMPAVLIECGFLSNDEEREFLKRPENHFEIAAAITKGISDVLIN